MQGVSQHTFQPLGGFDRVVQALGKILTTPIGSRVMRRDFGSRIPALLDAPMNEFTVLDFAMAAAEAVDRWEPTVRLEKVALVEAGAEGVGALDLTLTYLEDGRTVTVRIAL